MYKSVIMPLIHTEVKVINLKKDEQLFQGLTYFGFNFSLRGTKYLQEVMLLILEQPKCLLSLNSMVFSKIAINNNNSIKNIEGDIKWSIKNVFSKGIIQEFCNLGNNQTPTIKQMIILLFDYIMD